VSDEELLQIRIRNDTHALSREDGRKLVAEIDRLRRLLKSRMKVLIKGIQLNGQPIEFESIEFVEAEK
jgi:hypothetical protein